MKNKKLLRFNKDKLITWVLYWFVVGSGVFTLLFLATSTWIGVGVIDNCKLAQASYDGDCVEALINVLNDENNSYRERNNAIWSLGQLGDKRALPVLQTYYTGNIPDREPYDEMISQYELKKAITLTEGGFNITAFVWRSGIEE